NRRHLPARDRASQPLFPRPPAGAIRRDPAHRRDAGARAARDLGARRNRSAGNLSVGAVNPGAAAAVFCLLRVLRSLRALRGSPFVPAGSSSSQIRRRDISLRRPPPIILAITRSAAPYS